MDVSDPAPWDGISGTAGGPVFGAALLALANERGLELAALAAGSGLDTRMLEEMFSGERRVATAILARLAQALSVRAIEFLQRTNLLSLEVYAAGLDPLYFLPAGQVRKDARIYMREINPRHRVPERDMTGRNPALKALAGDEILDPLGKLELELTYLLRAAAQSTGGRL